MVHAPTEVNRGYLEHIRQWSGERRVGGITDVKNRLLYGRLTRLLFLPVVPLVGVGVFLRVRFALTSAQREVDALHEDAMRLVDQFVDQYPLHLYPIVAKALELACLKRTIPPLLGPRSRIAEVAIGDGTLSAQVFGKDQRLTALDLSPYSLSKAARLPHVERTIVSDCLSPPLRSGAFDLLIANNFLHHVTDKSQTLLKWSRVAPALAFNENTRFWASGWTVPYLMDKIGLKRQAARRASSIERLSMQHLEHRNDLNRHVEGVCRIKDSTSFMSERTFFYCSLLSFALRCFGPPTPSTWKRLALGPLRAFVRPLTRALARDLIRFDAGESRDRDTFVMYICSTDAVRAGNTADLACPACSGEIDAADRCASCGRKYSRLDGMLFLLPDEFEHVRLSYRSDVARELPAEHL